MELILFCCDSGSFGREESVHYNWNCICIARLPQKSAGNSSQIRSEQASDVY